MEIILLKKTLRIPLCNKACTICILGITNFPLAFSILGGDTVSALATGCRVVFKAHPGHMATTEIVANCIQKVVSKLNLPKGTFNMIFGARVGKDLVQYPLANSYPSCNLNLSELGDASNYKSLCNKACQM